MTEADDLVVVLRAAQKWFNLVLMLSIIVMGAGLISFAVVRRESIPPGALGADSQLRSDFGSQLRSPSLCMA